ncbi:phosphate-binding protein [Wenjunlia vitaminophila]|uniref:Phosphate-binding protein n=1 Tax=Wenjunlia vitaminophila TaxID=76728 RepID=A0A0T6LYG8_WENVI|nr:phosphate ABC transporter substrate-binding protein PstS [Wenjunlia vitaminophila]KRV51080.1 phosphate-binding protein [Wenjunlia vitaminophila]
MKLQRIGRSRGLALGAVAVVTSLTLAACGSDDNSDTDQGDPTKAANAADVTCGDKGELLAAGSSAQKNAMDQWVKDFQAACSGTTINYQANGSGAGIESFLAGKVAFAGSDAALKPEEVERSKEVCDSGQGINLPMVVGPIAVGYNLKGVDNLVLDAKTMAGIFDSKIKKWDDQSIKDLNPGVDLPSTPIQTVHRSDDSGTTKNFLQYLSAAAPDAWSYEADKKWPAKGGQSADGSSGVAAQVKQAEGSIGYFEISYADANQIKTVALDTGAGEPIVASTEAASKAIAEAKIVGQGNDLAMEVAYDTKAAGAYPISLVTYEIVCDKGNNSDTLKSVKAFLEYTASEAGQQSIADKGYAPLPTEVAEKVRKVIPTLS